MLVYFSTTDESKPPKGLMTLKKATVSVGGASSSSSSSSSFSSSSSSFSSYFVATPERGEPPSAGDTDPQDGELLTLTDASGESFVLSADTKELRDAWAEKLEKAAGESSR
jgi:hypothetical protein